MSWMSPVPTRLRMPSGSFMTREMRIPDLVLSKKRTGRRTRCACTSSRMRAMARCAATLTTCESENDVTACTSVAPPAEQRERHEQGIVLLGEHLVDQVLGAERAARSRPRG